MNKPALKFNSGKFKIMLVGDIHEHFGTGDKRSLKTIKDVYALLSKASDELKPDLVVFLGDNCRASDESEMRSVASKILYPFTVRNIPVSLVFGNHDRECDVSLRDQVRIYSEFENCYVYNADDSITGYGNFNLLIKDSEGKNDIFNLWFIDSNNLSEDKDISYYDWVHQDQIDWYEKTAEIIKNNNNGKVIPSFVFQHIPVPEEYELLREAKIYELPDSVRGYGKHSDKFYVLKDGVEGYLGEGPCSPCVNSGQFESWKKTGDVIGAFFGHDHMNDFQGKVDGILLAQSKLAGFNPYTDGCNGGVRLLTLYEDNITDFDSEMYHFKDFGLKSESLDFYKRHITDRQDMKIKFVMRCSVAVAASVAVTKTVKKISSSRKKN